MCNPAAIAFGKSRLSRAEVQGKRVIEVGALDVNGSLRTDILELQPGSYIGVDMISGPGVDEICNIHDLVARYGERAFDLVICTEVLEHVRDWRDAISNLKRVLDDNGILLVTTRSFGFPYHGFPHDFWRYELEDFRVLFGDMRCETIEPDPFRPGVFMKATRPAAFSEQDLSSHELYSIIRARRCREITDMDYYLSWCRRTPRALLARMLPASFKQAVRRRLAARHRR